MLAQDVPRETLAVFGRGQQIVGARRENAVFHVKRLPLRAVFAQMFHVEHYRK